MEAHKYIRSLATGEIVEKKSRFIATLTPVSTEEEALKFIEAMKKKYYDARHNCSAYIIGDDGKCSDDGEPSHTAGRPMLDVLSKGGYTNVCVVVTRYFGGVLLGTGGLVRAYSDAVKEALENASVYTLRPMLSLHIETDYQAYGKLEYLATTHDYILKNVNYTDSVSLDLFIPPEDEQVVLSTLTNLTGGKGNVSKGDIIDM